MKKTALLTLISVLLVSAVAGTQFLKTALAQMYPLPPGELPNPPKVTITSPINQTVYTENDLPLTITIYAPWMSEYRARVTSILYRLDYMGPFPFNVELGPETSYSILLQDLRQTAKDRE